MGELRDPTRESLAAIVTGLVERHGGPTKVAALVNVERTAIHRWMNGDVSIHRLALLADRLNEPLVVRFGPDTTKEPPPEWARAMEQNLVKRLDRNGQLIERLIPDELLLNSGALIELLEELQRRRGEDPPEGSGEPDPGEESPQVQANGSPPDQDRAQ